MFLAYTPVPERGEGTASGIPDMRFINKKIAVVRVAEALEISQSPEGKLHCWHPERHFNGDRTASVGIRKSNNTVKCFGCDSRPLGPIDLVMDVLGLKSPAEAAIWVATRFPVPQIPKSARIIQQKRFIERAGYEGEMGLLVRSCLWAELSAAARCLAPVLLEFAPRERGQLSDSFELSYAALRRYGGVRSPNAISKALRELQEIGWLVIEKENAEPPLRRVSAYTITPYSDALSELAHSNAARAREEVEVERAIRAEARSIRKRKYEER